MASCVICWRALNVSRCGWVAAADVTRCPGINLHSDAPIVKLIHCSEQEQALRMVPGQRAVEEDEKHSVG